jgi:hypothetical protein
MFLYFKALLAFVRDYNQEGALKSSSATPRPLFVVRLDHVRRAGAVSETELCFFLWRYLVFAFTCTDSAYECESENEDFQPDFTVDKFAAIRVELNGDNKSIKETVKLEFRNEQCWLMGPLPTAEELWTMLLLFTKKQWQYFPTVFFKSMFDTLLLRPSTQKSSSISHCIFNRSKGNEHFIKATALANTNFNTIALPTKKVPVFELLSQTQQQQMGDCSSIANNTAAYEKYLIGTNSKQVNSSDVAEMYSMDTLMSYFDSGLNLLNQFFKFDRVVSSPATDNKFYEDPAMNVNVR